jgi:hypothetical protein
LRREFEIESATDEGPKTAETNQAREFTIADDQQISKSNAELQEQLDQAKSQISDLSVRRAKQPITAATSNRVSGLAAREGIS